MAKQIKIGQIGDYLEERAELLLRSTVLATDKKLKEGSPVDTGRFRVSWQVGENDATGEPAPPGEYDRAITPPKGTNYTPGQERLGNVYSVHNNIPYAESLAQGHSVQAPAGWIDAVAKDMQAYVDSNWRKITRES